MISPRWDLQRSSGDSWQAQQQGVCRGWSPSTQLLAHAKRNGCIFCLYLYGTRDFGSLAGFLPAGKDSTALFFVHLVRSSVAQLIGAAVGCLLSASMCRVRVCLCKSRPVWMSEPLNVEGKRGGCRASKACPCQPMAGAPCTAVAQIFEVPFQSAWLQQRQQADHITGSPLPSPRWFLLAKHRCTEAATKDMHACFVPNQHRWPAFWGRVEDETVAIHLLQLHHCI